MGKGLLIGRGYADSLSYPILTNEGTNNDLLLGKQLINSKGEVITGSFEPIELNFEIKAYESELLIPETTRENTIAVVTETPITAYTIAASEPTAPVEGMVWIMTDDALNVSFSATMQNPVLVNPSSVRQYVGGAWERKTAKLYQNGAWIVLGVVYLYNEGDRCAELTGDYRTLGTYYGACTINVAPVITYNATSVNVVSNTTEGAGVWVTTNKINLEKFSKLCMKGELVAKRGNQYLVSTAFAAFSNVGNKVDWASNRSASTILQLWDGDDRTEKLVDPVIDISNLTGSYYIGIGQYIHRAYSSASAYIEKIWLE